MVKENDERLMIPDMLLTLQSVLDHERERQDGMNIEVGYGFPLLSSLDDLTILGSFSWSAYKKKWRWLNAHHAMRFNDILVTPSDLARSYIRLKYPKKLRCNSRQYAYINNKKSPPLWAEVWEGEGVYLDLKSAYWQVLQAGGWDVDYSYGRFIGTKETMDDFPFPHIKLARNSMVGISVPSQIPTFAPNRQWGKIRPRYFQNLVLWSFVQDVMHTFASDLLMYAGAKYVNTDGYIVPRENVKTAMQIANDWGLLLLVKHEGYATVRGAGDYDIAGHKSGRPARPRPIRKVYPVESPSWLRSRFVRLSKRIHWYDVKMMWDGRGELMSDIRLTEDRFELYHIRDETNITGSV